MKVYLAAAFCRKEEILAVAKQLEELGIVVTSRWLTEQKDVPTDTSRAPFLAERAQIDLDDIGRADMLIRFTDDLSASTVPSHLATGSRMGETMWALAHKKFVVVVGGHQCVFDYLPDVLHVKDIDHLKRFLPGAVQTVDGITEKCTHPDKYVTSYDGLEMCQRCFACSQWVTTSIWWKPWTWGTGLHIPLRGVRV